jgi:hypothetical protein
VAGGRLYEMVFRIGGKLAASFGTATAAAGKGLTDLERKAEVLSAKQQSLQAFGNVGKAFGGLKSELGGLVRDIGWLTAAGGGLGATLFGLAKSTADAADSADEDAQKLGLTIEALQELRYAAERSGAETSDLDAALGKMNVTLGKALAGGGSTGKAFEALGLSAAQLAAVAPDQALEQIADALHRIPNPAERAAAAQAIFGKGARQLGVMLADGSEGLRQMRADARATGAVLSSQTAKQASDFNDRLLDLQLTLGGLKNTFGAALLPVLTDLFTKLAAWLRQNRDRVEQLAVRFARWLEGSLPKLLELLEDLRDLAVTVADGAQKVADFLGGWDRLVYVLAGFKALSVASAVVDLGMALWAAVPAAWNLAAAALANPYAWIVIGILAEVAAIALAIAYWDEWTGWLKQAGYWVDALAAALFVMSGGTLGIPLLVLEIIRHWDTLVALWEGAKAVVVGLATAIWDKLVVAWDAVKIVVLAAVEVWLLVQRPLWLLLGLIARVYLAFWGLVWEVVQPVVGFIWSFWSGLIGQLWSLMTLLWDGLRLGWSLLVDWLSGLWREWGDTVIAVVRWVAARALELLTAPMRAGLALASLVPADAAPHLAELVGKLQGGLDAGIVAVEGSPATAGAAAGEAPATAPLLGAAPAPGTPAPAPLAESSARLAGAVSSRERTRQVSAPLTVTYQPQITVTGEGRADKPGMLAALKQGQDDLLERLKAAQEQQRRLAYG